MYSITFEAVLFIFIRRTTPIFFLLMQPILGKSPSQMKIRVGYYRLDCSSMRHNLR